MYSIVIPAYNEEETIGELLASVASYDLAGVIRVIVICNGCTDETFEVASSFAGVEVAESDEGKFHALNKGDELAGDDFPRLYLDADVRIDLSSVLSLLEAVDSEHARIAGPLVDFAVSSSSWSVRRYFRAQDTIPCVRKWREQHIVGRGMYALSQSGRARFDAFPPLRADDAFVDWHFSAPERVIVATSTAGISAPASLRALIRIQTRVVVANREVSALIGGTYPEPTTGKARWVDTWRHPSLGNLLVWLSVEALVRARVRFLGWARRLPTWR